MGKKPTVPSKNDKFFWDSGTPVVVKKNPKKTRKTKE